MNDLVAYIDVDDTLVRSFGTKRIPMTPVIEHVRALHRDGVRLYCWSSAGEEYARQSAEELGIAQCFVGFLPKPHVFIDDQPPADWRRTSHVFPGAVVGKTAADYIA